MGMETTIVRVVTTGPSAGGTQNPLSLIRVPYSRPGNQTPRRGISYERGAVPHDTIR